MKAISVLNKVPMWQKPNLRFFFFYIKFKLSSFPSPRNSGFSFFFRLWPQLIFLPWDFRVPGHEARSIRGKSIPEFSPLEPGPLSLLLAVCSTGRTLSKSITVHFPCLLSFSYLGSPSSFCHLASPPWWEYQSGERSGQAGLIQHWRWTSETSLASWTTAALSYWALSWSAAAALWS